MSPAEKQSLIVTYITGYRQVVRASRATLGKTGEKIEQIRAIRNDLWSTLQQAEAHVEVAIRDARGAGAWDPSWPQSALELRQRASGETLGLGLAPLAYAVIVAIGAVLVGFLTVGFYRLADKIDALVASLARLLENPAASFALVGIVAIGLFYAYRKLR